MQFSALSAFHACRGVVGMRFPWANIALIALFAVELVTGYLGLTHNNPEWIAAMHIHRITGFSILALFLWKSRNILGSFRTGQNWKIAPGDHAGLVRPAGGPARSVGAGAGMEPFRAVQFPGFLRHHHPPEPGPAAHTPVALALLTAQDQLPYALCRRPAQCPALGRAGGGRAGVVAGNGPAEHPCQAARWQTAASPAHTRKTAPTSR